MQSKKKKEKKENRAVKDPAGTDSSPCLTHQHAPHPRCWEGRRWGEKGGKGLFFTVRDLIARRFHYLGTNVTFSSDQGARRPPAARRVRSQSQLSGPTEVPAQVHSRGRPPLRQLPSNSMRYHSKTNIRRVRLEHSGSHGLEGVCRSHTFCSCKVQRQNGGGGAL